MAKTFDAKLQPGPQGGHYVVVPEKIAAAAQLKHAMRVRGTVNGAGYRSSLMVYGGICHLGVHKATLAEAGVQPPVRVKVTIEADDEPLPTDIVPPDLERELGRNRKAGAAWQALSPSGKREHVQSLLSAKKPETRTRRLEKIMLSLVSTARP